MNIREAILATAKHIEQYPEEFRFSSIDIPEKTLCGTPGCAVGWVAHFRGLTRIARHSAFSDAMGVRPEVFYERMAAFDHHDPFSTGNWGPWRLSPEHCARNLRLYADRYHPAERTGLPDAVRAIFTRPADAPPPATAEEWMALHDRTIEAIKRA